MVSVDINTSPKLEDILQKVEGGESVEVRRAGKLVAVIRPPGEEELDALADVAAGELANTFPPKEWAPWDPKHVAG